MACPLLPSGASPHREFWTGVQRTLPLIVGAIPFGLIFGTLAPASGLSWGATLAMSAWVFAGSAQFIALGLVGAGSPIGLVVLTTAVVNLRHVLYAVGLVPYLRQVGPLWKLTLGFLLTDETYLVAIQRYQQPDASPYRPWFHLGSAVAMYVSWQLCTLVGLTLGQTLPSLGQWGLDFAMVVTFIGMTVPYLVRRPAMAAAVVAGGVALGARALPHQLGLLVATLAGVGAGLLSETIRSPLRPPP